MIAYLAGGLGPAGGALATLLHDGGAARGACGCTEGEACCGAACCAPAESAPLPPCCAEPGAVVGDASEVSEPAPALPPGALALVSRCTCGHRDHQGACIHPLDTHLPTVTRTGSCPPPSSPRAAERAAAFTDWRPEPRDRVPKPSCAAA